MKQKLILFIIRLLIPTEPKARKKFIKALFPNEHLHRNPRKGVFVMKIHKNNFLHKDTLCGEEEPACGFCPDEPIRCLRVLERMQEKADMKRDLKKDKEI